MRHIQQFFVAIFSSWALLSLAAPSPVLAGPVGLLVPAYFDPSADSADWNRMCSAATQVPLIAVMNPDNGPGQQRDVNYLSANINLDLCGGSTIGYVHTRYGKRPLAQVKRDVRRYFDWYQPDGIFIDEMPSTATPSNLEYYKALARYIRLIYPQAIIVGNPGTGFSESFAKAGVADLFVDEEDASVNANSTPQAAWTQSYPASLFAEIAIASPSDGQEATLLAGRHLAWVYSTTRGASNSDPYAALPPDFNQEVAALLEVNATR